jgi:hypothetical protein
MVAAKLANLPQRRPPLKSPIGDFFEGPRPGSVSQADAAALLSRSPTTVSLESAAMTLAGLLFSCWPNGFREGLDIQGQAIADRDRRINQRIGNEARKNERRNNREDFDSAPHAYSGLSWAPGDLRHLPDHASSGWQRRAKGASRRPSLRRRGMEVDAPRYRASPLSACLGRCFRSCLAIGHAT